MVHYYWNCSRLLGWQDNARRRLRLLVELDTRHYRWYPWRLGLRIIRFRIRRHLRQLNYSRYRCHPITLDFLILYQTRNWRGRIKSKRCFAKHLLLYIYNNMFARARKHLFKATKKHASEITRNYCWIHAWFSLNLRAISTEITNDSGGNHAQIRRNFRTNSEEITRDFGGNFCGFINISKSISYKTTAKQYCLSKKNVLFLQAWLTMEP